MNASSLSHTALSALQNAQAGIDLTSQNVAGQTAAGFVRRRLDAGIDKVLSSAAPPLGNGVSVSGFSRDWSALLQQQRVRQAGVTAYHGAITSAFRGLDGQVADPALAMDESVNAFFTSLGLLATNPASGSALVTVKAQGGALLAAARNFKDSLAQVSSDAAAHVATDIKSANAIAGELALINRQLAARPSTGSSGPDAALLDRRDELLLKAGALVGGDLGVNGDGLAYVFVDGQPLVNGLEAAALVVRDDAADDAGVLLAMQFDRGQGAPVQIGLRSAAVQGELGAQLLLARTPSEVTHPNGQVDQRIRAFTDLFSAEAGEVPAQASQLTRALAVLGAFNDKLPGTTSAMVDDALQGLAVQTNSNDEASNADALRSGLLQAWHGFIANVGSQVTTHESARSGSAVVEARLRADFQSQSGVNLDEEAANLMNYQRAFSAAGKLLQAQATLLDDLLAIVGR